MSISPIAVQREEVQQDLWARTAAVAGQLNRAHADLVEIACELIDGGHWGDGGFRSPEHYFTVRAGLSPAHARDVVVVARRRGDLPDAAAAVSDGELSLDAAAVVAHHVPASYQASMTHLARHSTVPQLRRAVSRHAFHDPGAEEVVPDAAPDRADAPSESERRACARPELSMQYDRDGRFQLRYSAPATIGALVEQAVREAKDALFTQQQGDPTDAAVDPASSGPTGNARAAQSPSYADALAEVAHRSLAGVSSTSRASHYRVYLHLDTAGAWINNRGAIPQRLVARFLTDGVLQPVWETEGRPISVGRTMRILPARARRLIEDRDQGCRFPGCTATRFVEIHHLEEWASGGPTDDDNQVSLCPFHHDAIDRGDFTIGGDPTRPDGLSVTNRYGLPIRPPTQAELAPPRAGDPPGPHPPRVGEHPAYHPPTGERVRWSDIELPSDRELRDTLTPQLRMVDAADARFDVEPAEIERDAFDVIRRWDESG